MRQQYLRVISGAVLVGMTGAGCFDTRLIADENAAGSPELGAGGVPSAPTAGTAPVGNGAGHGGAGSTDGEAGAAGETSAGAGQAGQPGAPGVTWLSLVGSQAPSTESANRSLGINGAFYAYKDDCATLEWDPATRCASGHLCTVGANYENWGIAVGFDFSSTGPNGTPPDAKLVWNPEQAGARGVTWRIRGQAPGLQLWMLNMAPRFGGRCSEMSCEIAGPPDGTGSAALTGTLLFDQMVKDHWGSGVAYVYDPALAYALQFKLPAINVGSASFDFCVEALGVIR